MPLLTLALHNFRLFDQCCFSFHPNRNVIYGGNAAGKSTVLEAIQFLSTSKSSRSKSTDKLIRNGETWFSVRGDSVLFGEKHELSIAVLDGEKRLTVNGVGGAKTAEIARFLPVSLISPDSHYEFQKDSRQRRSSMDWVLFHVEQDYLAIWGRYQRILQQRNAGLKNQTGIRSITAWNEELALHGDAIHERRAELIDRLNPFFSKICSVILPNILGAKLELLPGWKSELGMATCLVNDFAQDKRHGYTHSGPHRSDLVITATHRKDPSEFSHGQRKLLFVALKLAQTIFLKKTSNLDSTLLIDDLAAELDTDRTDSVISLLSDFPCQIILTSIDPHPWVDKMANFGSFHVKHGKIVQV